MMARAESSPLAVYNAYLAQGQLAYQYSPAAGRAVFFPRLVCPYTGSTELEWRVASGLGRVHATSTIHQKGEAPYNVVLVDCDEGFRMMSRIEGVPPDSVSIGLRVRVSIIPGASADDAPLPCFVVEQE